MRKFKSFLKRQCHLSWSSDDIAHEPQITYEPNVSEEANPSVVHDWANPMKHERHIESDSRGNNSGSVLTNTDSLSMSEHALTFKKEHHDALHYYKGNSQHINIPLRSGALHHDEYDGGNNLSNWHEHKDFVQRMDHITNHALPKDHVTFRGMTKRFNAGSLKPGDHITDYGFTGTSHSPDIAKEFSHKTGTSSGVMKEHLFRIHMPAGTKAYHLDRHENDHDHEQETLLARGTRFRVGNHHDYHHHHVIDLHVVSQGHEPPTNPVSGAKVYD